ncbi:hypothetical protein XU18_5107 [Perkinsela sp. CCAP 1560/4]|nr:hypothetical protein XU18_5107 [Perkinsela sp. CCAP 1560/4]|eukprot:KNH01739.1 hypothetical protein XU18_5107 [Perkinsela sp. CCAP 1560/4]
MSVITEVTSVPRQCDTSSAPSSAFNFENTNRNAQFAEASNITHSQNLNSQKITKTKKTGTTIVGVVFPGGVVLGADTRATNGVIVADKNCEKIHFMAPNIMCCGAGTAADTEKLTALISSKLTLSRLASGKQSRVVVCQTFLKNHLYQHQGHIGAAIVLGGCDVNGSHLATIAPHGNSDELPFVSMGSGSLAAMAVLEMRYRDDMTESAAKQLVADAIQAGILNDLGSGSNVDLCVLRKDGTRDMIREAKVVATRAFHRPSPIHFPKHTTRVVETHVERI